MRGATMLTLALQSAADLRHLPPITPVKTAIRSGPGSNTCSRRTGRPRPSTSFMTSAAPRSPAGRPPPSARGFAMTSIRPKSASTTASAGVDRRLRAIKLSTDRATQRAGHLRRPFADDPARCSGKQRPRCACEINFQPKGTYSPDWLLWARRSVDDEYAYPVIGFGVAGAHAAVPGAKRPAIGATCAGAL